MAQDLAGFWSVACGGFACFSPTTGVRVGNGWTTLCDRGFRFGMCMGIECALAYGSSGVQHLEQQHDIMPGGLAGCADRN